MELLPPPPGAECRGPRRGARTAMPEPTANDSCSRASAGASPFFRDPQTLEALTHAAMAQRIRTASVGDPLRVWVPACGAGAEVYTIAICLLEQMRSAHPASRLQLLATDTDDEALRLTRAGLYARSGLEALSAEQVSGFFEPAGEGRMRAREALRELISIGPHDALRDPPIFSRLDLISGRNLPAHPAPEAARHFAASAHFALRADGWLLLAEGCDGGALLERFDPTAGGLPLYHKRALAAERARPARAPHRPESQIARLSGELESANAELDALKARLHSLSGERAGLDAELQRRIRSLEAGDGDLSRLIDMLGVAAVFLDPEERIRRYTGGAERLLRITAGDLGRSLAALGSPLVDAALLDAVRHAIAADCASHREIHSEDHHWYLRRIQPHAATNLAEGVLITWVDITPVKALQEEVSRIAALEQLRIGQELHDGIQQELTALGLFAQNLNEALAGRAEPREHQWAGRLTEGLAAVNRHVQALARGLVPAPVDSASLAPALAELARTTGEATQLACEFTLEGEVRLPNSDTSSHLYRIAQEAVRNATRHAHADRIAIRLSAQGSAVRLEVRDNGIGIPPRAGFGRGVGLRLMEHRCSLIGGTFAAQSVPGGGTRVVCALPGADAPG